MKALIGFLSLTLGGVVIALILKIQTDPFAFTSYVPTAAPAANVAPTPSPVQKRVIALGDVTVVGHLSRQLFHKAQRAAPPRTKAPPPEPRVKVIPAPCVDGQYRKLEAHRGVRLMCPH